MNAYPAGDDPANYAADGFPIDRSLQRRARRAAIGYGVLALYYLSTLPFVLRYVRWGGLQALSHDLALRSELLIMLVGYVGTNLVLAVAAWKVIAMRRWTSWSVVVLAALVTLGIWSLLGYSLWRTISMPAPLDVLNLSIKLCLLGVYSYCFIELWSAVRSVNAQRFEARSAIEGRIQA